MFPVHTWLADTTEKATPGTSVLLVCVLDKIGTFGMLRFCLGLLPEASQWATPVVVVLALISIIYGALVAIGQDDILRLIGLTSLSHFGFIVLGIFVFSSTRRLRRDPLHGQPRHRHRALFLVAGLPDPAHRHLARSARSAGSRRSRRCSPGFFLVAGLAAAGLPGLSPFVSEFLVIIAAFDHHWLVGVGRGAGHRAGGVLRALDVPAHDDRPRPRRVRCRCADLDRREVGIVAPLLLALVLFGFFPKPLLDVINPSSTTPSRAWASARRVVSQ